MILVKNSVLDFFKLVFLVIIFRICLDYGYIKFVHPLYEYSGFNFSFELTRYIFSWLISLLIFFALYCRKNLHTLNYIYFLIYSVSILPMISFYALSGKGINALLSSIFVLLISYIFLPKYFSINNNPVRLNSNKKILIYFIFFISILNLIYLIYMNGGKYILSFSDVYDYRAENADSYSGIFGYLNNWTTKVLIPFLIAVGIVYKNVRIILCSILLCLLFFAFSGHKSILLPFILCFFLGFVFSGKGESYYFRFVSLCLFGLILFSMLGVILYLFNDDLIFGSVFFRRAFFVPAYLNDIYFEMFGNQYNHVYWSNSILSSYIYYPYGDTSVAKVVGAYLGQPEMGANTGFVSSGFMQAGYWGIFIYTIFLIIINLFLSKISTKVDPIIFNSILFMPFLALFTSSDFFTSLLTHGLIFAILLLLLYSGLLKLKF